MDIKDLNEALNALELILVNVKGAFKDKSIKVDDFQYLVNIITNFEVLQNGLIGSNQIPKELKDLNAEEAKQLVLRLIEILSKLR